MIVDWFYIVHGVRKWIDDEEATAVIEAAMLFPPMITLLMGVYDLGNGIVLAQKTIVSSQIAADLVARNRTVNSGDVEQIINASHLAYEPYGLNNYGIDIASLRFDASSNPVVIWRVTRDMAPNATAVQSTRGLGLPEGEGMIIVTVKYNYIPFFSQLFLQNFTFQEVAFTRGRRSPTVTWE